MRNFATLSAVCLATVACGGGSKGPSTPTPVTRSTRFAVFLDENHDGLLEPTELIRVPGVDVSFGSASGKSAPTTGEFSAEVAQTTQTLSINPASLPPYYQATTGISASPPTTGTFNVPVTLPLGATASPGVFLAFGDSITDGQVGTGDGQGYTGMLERMLSTHFGKARVINDGLDSSNSERGDARIQDSLAGGRPAFTLILYGTNDWSDSRCGQQPCFTVSSLRSMVRKVKAAGGFPFVGTLLMTNVGNDFRASPQRNAWVIEQNEGIRQMALEEQVVLVDLHRAFELSPLQYSELFADYIHPSAEGYKVLAQAWFDAITKPR
ncbi:MAG: SGNH/GDSL hydrolase family protein [Vicinamibacteria bacterium]